MAFSKIILNGTTLIDLTVDDVSAADVNSGVYFHLPSGVRTAGTDTDSGGVDGDNLEYGASLIGTALVGTAVVS